MPAGVRSPAALVTPGCFCCTYIKSSKLTRLRLKAVVSALARLLATTSIRVERARSPVAAECSAVIPMRVLSEGKAQSDEFHFGVARTPRLQRASFTSPRRRGLDAHIESA